MLKLNPILSGFLNLNKSVLTSLNHYSTISSENDGMVLKRK